MIPGTPLHSLDPTGRFSDRAADYAMYRPSYPSAAVDAVLSGLGEPTRLRAVDVGAGTGISTRLLAERGVRVIAVEPNRPMREMGAGTTPGLVEWRDGTAEATGLAPCTADLVLCAQAFHWFRPREALREFCRILRPGGRLALMWNDRDENDPGTAEYGRLVREASANSPAESHAHHHRALKSSDLFRGFRRVVVNGGQALDREGLIGRARSASYVPKEGREWDTLSRALADLHGQFADSRGLMTLAYVTRVYLAEASTEPVNAPG
jgi:SAM-dependent methyltransferase